MPNLIHLLMYIKTIYAPEKNIDSRIKNSTIVRSRYSSNLDHCFGAFAVHLNEKDEVVCGCSGDECSKYKFLINLGLILLCLYGILSKQGYNNSQMLLLDEDPCNKCKVAAEAKGLKTWACPCPLLVITYNIS